MSVERHVSAATSMGGVSNAVLLSVVPVASGGNRGSSQQSLPPEFVSPRLLKCPWCVGFMNHVSTTHQEVALTDFQAHFSHRSGHGVCGEGGHLRHADLQSARCRVKTPVRKMCVKEICQLLHRQERRQWTKAREFTRSGSRPGFGGWDLRGDYECGTTETASVPSVAERSLTLVHVPNPHERGTVCNCVRWLSGDAGQRWRLEQDCRVHTPAAAGSASQRVSNEARAPSERHR